MGEKSIEEITAKLEEAQAGVSKEVESPTTDKETVAAETSDETEKGTTKKGSAAQARIQELVARAKAFETELETTKSKYADKEAEVGKLIDLVKDRETDARIVAKINELHKTPEYKDVVEKLDRAIRGLEPLPETKTDAKGETPAPNVDLLKGIKGEVEKLAERQALETQDLRSDLLLQKSELVLEKLFAQLPTAEYTEDDRRILNSALADFIDWDAIEKKPAALEQLVAAGFQKVTDWYGDPRGRIAAEAAKTTQKGTDAKSETDVDYSKLDYGKLEKVTVNGKEHMAPKITDAEFSAMMGAALRKERGGR